MLQTYWYKGDKLEQNLPAEKCRDILSREDGFLWVDMEDPTDDEIAVLSDVFNFHPLAIEDCIFPQHRPKVDDYASYLYVIFHSIALKDGIPLPENLDVLELNIFVGSNYLVTFHEDHIPQVSQIRSRCAMQPNFLSKGPGFLLHALMDVIVDEMTRVLARIDDRLDEVEDKILADDEGAIEELNKVKELVAKFRKVAGPQRDVVRALTSTSYSYISGPQTFYFKDILDHLFVIIDTTNHFREVISFTMDTYLSMVSKKLNSVMKVLTVVTMIFLPLNLIAGIYGMNFSSIPLAESEFGFHGVLAMMALVSVALIIVFRRLKWF